MEANGGYAVVCIPMELKPEQTAVPPGELMSVDPAYPVREAWLWGWGRGCGSQAPGAPLEQPLGWWGQNRFVPVYFWFI